jgi:hypothetical protein
MAPFPLGIIALAGAGGGGFAPGWFGYTTYSSNYNSSIAYDSGNVWFGTTDSSVATPYPALTHKIDSDGVYQFGRTLQANSGTRSMFAYGRATYSGDSYETGEGPQTFSGGAYAAKYNSSGVLQWKKDWGNPAYPNAGYACQVSTYLGVPKIMFIGLNYDNVNFQTVMELSEADGTEIGTGYKISGPEQPATDKGNGYFANDGFFIPTYDVFGTARPSLWRIQANGSGVTWAKRDSSDTSKRIKGVTRGFNNKIYISGDIDDGTLYGRIAQLSVSNGLVDWEKKYTADSRDCYGQGITTDTSGNTYVAFDTGGTAPRPMYLLKINSSGVVQWQKKISSSIGSISAEGMTSDNSEFLYFTGGLNSRNFVMKYPMDGSIDTTVNIPLTGGTITIEPASGSLTDYEGHNWGAVVDSFSSYYDSQNWSASNAIGSTKTGWEVIA